MDFRARLKNYAEQRRAIRELQALDDHALRDIGVDRQHIRKAVRGT